MITRNGHAEFSSRAESTSEYQRLIDEPDIIRGWDNQTLLLHFLGVRFVIMTETAVSSDIDRIAAAIRVGRLEHEEILRRMKEGHSSE